MRTFVQVTLVAAWFGVISASPLPQPRYSSSDNEQTVHTAAAHLFGDEGFPLRVPPHVQVREFAAFPGDDSDGGRVFRTPLTRDQPPYSFFFDMHDMMKILRDQMTEVLARSPPDLSSGGHDDGLLPSDVKNQSTTKVEYLDGHKVVINDTTYSNGDTNAGSIFHVQIVDLLPLGPEGPSDPSFETVPLVPTFTGPLPTPKTRINEVDSGKSDVAGRDREEVEIDDDEIGEDIDKVEKKPAKKPETKEKEKPKEQDPKEVQPEVETVTIDTGIDPRQGEKKVEKKDEKKEEKSDDDKKEDKLDDDKKEEKSKGEKDRPVKDEVETFDGPLVSETGDEEGEDIPEEAAPKKMERTDDKMQTSESRWQNEIDNRIDTYQPAVSHNTYERNFNRQPDYYYEPYYKPKVNWQPAYNPTQPKYQPSYSYQPNNFAPTYSPPSYTADQGYNSYEVYPEKNRFVDLSGDTKVNDYMAEQQQAGLITIDPDAEIIDINKKPVPKFHYPRYNYRNY